MNKEQLDEYRDLISRLSEILKIEDEKYERIKIKEAEDKKRIVFSMRAIRKDELFMQDQLLQLLIATSGIRNEFIEIFKNNPRFKKIL